MNDRLLSRIRAALATGLQHESMYSDAQGYSAATTRLGRNLSRAMKQPSNVRVSGKKVIDLEAFAATQEGKAFLVQTAARAQIRLARAQSKILTTNQNLQNQMQTIDLNAARSTMKNVVKTAQHQVLLGGTMQDEQQVNVITRGVSSRSKELIP